MKGAIGLGATEIIGTQQAGDYRLEPAEHAKLYADAAPDLAALLGTARVTVIAEEYQQRDAEADGGQKSFKRTMSTANIAVLVAATSSACMMAAEIVLGGTDRDGVAIAAWTGNLVFPLGLIAAISAAAATAALYFVRSGRLFENWMTKRAAAENARLSYFVALAESPASTPELELLKLEYFRRYQYEVQEEYYLTRGAAHRASAQRTMFVGGAGIFIAALTGGFASLAEGMATALAAIAVIGAAISAYAASREAMTQDRRNAERYDRTLTALRGLYGRLDRVRQAVANGNREALVEFVGAVNEQISLEHRQWLESSEATKEGIAKLDAALARAQPAKADGTSPNV